MPLGIRRKRRRLGLARLRAWPKSRPEDTVPMRLFQRLSFKSKLLFLILAMVILIGGTMGLLIRIAVFPYLLREIELRGQNTAQRLAESARAPIFQRDRVRLTAIIFEEKQIDKNISYIVVSDEKGAVLAHTFMDAAPLEALSADKDSATPNPVQTGWWSFLTRPTAQSQILLPVFEGLHQIGAIRVGLHPEYIDRLIFELRIYNLLFVGFVMLVGLFFGLYLSRIITRPVLTLTAFAREISLGNLDKRLVLGNRKNCYEVLECTKAQCPAYGRETLRCWFIDGTCMREGPVNFPEKLESCKSCPVYWETAGDEIVQLADTFNHMTSRLSTSEHKTQDLGGPLPLALQQRSPPGFHSFRLNLSHRGRKQPCGRHLRTRKTTADRHEVYGPHVRAGPRRNPRSVPQREKPDLLLPDPQDTPSET